MCGSAPLAATRTDGLAGAAAVAVCSAMVRVPASHCQSNVVAVDQKRAYQYCAARQRPAEPESRRRPGHLVTSDWRRSRSARAPHYTGAGTRAARAKPIPRAGPRWRTAGQDSPRWQVRAKRRPRTQALSSIQGNPQRKPRPGQRQPPGRVPPVAAWAGKAAPASADKRSRNRPGRRWQWSPHGHRAWPRHDFRIGVRSVNQRGSKGSPRHKAAPIQERRDREKLSYPAQPEPNRSGYEMPGWH
jgi:hypothetical protein